jgi:phenylacetic acid degradation operon negative regulatory protein
MFPRVTAHALRLVHRRAMVEDGWVVLVFSESERDKRHVLRTTLTRLGLKRLHPGFGSRQDI